MAIRLETVVLALGAGTGFVIAVAKLAHGAVHFFGMRTRGEVISFESILKAQVNLLEDCRKSFHQQSELLRHTELTLKREREDRDRERHHLYRQLTEVTRRVFEYEGILRRHSWHDPRREPRSPADEQKEA